MLDPVDTAAGAFQTPTPFSPFLAVIVQIPASGKWQGVNNHYYPANPIILLPFPRPIALLAPQGDETSGALESPSKRLRLADDPDTWLEVRSVTPTVLEKLQQYWKSLWHDKKNIFRHCSVPRDINYVQGIDVPATMEVLDLPRTFASIGNVMVRDDYAEAMRAIEGYCTRNTKSVVIVGHPGIGRTMGSVWQAVSTQIYTTLSREDHPVILHFGQTSSRRKANYPSEQCQPSFFL